MFLGEIGQSIWGYLNQIFDFFDKMVSCTKHACFCFKCVSLSLLDGGNSSNDRNRSSLICLGNKNLSCF